MSEAPAALSLPPEVFEGVTAVWRRGARVFETAFGGDSMRPAIAPGQPVVVDCGVEPGAGDVAVFHFDGRVGVHRVMRAHVDWLLSWGDANALPDQPIRHDQVIGTLRDIPAMQRSLRRALLLTLLAPAGAGFDRVNRRVAGAQALHRAWQSGLPVFLAFCAGKLARRWPFRGRTPG